MTKSYQKRRTHTNVAKGRAILSSRRRGEKKIGKEKGRLYEGDSVTYSVGERIFQKETVSLGKTRTRWDAKTGGFLLSLGLSKECKGACGGKTRLERVNYQCTVMSLKGCVGLYTAIRTVQDWSSLSEKNNSVARPDSMRRTHHGGGGLESSSPDRHEPWDVHPKVTRRT